MKKYNLLKHSTPLLATLFLVACGGGDGSGDGDTNNTQTEQTLSPTLASIQTNVFTSNCATSGCHLGATAQLGLELSNETNSRNNLVNFTSVENTSLLRVNPSDPDNSYLIKKLEGTAGITGGQMPLGKTPLSQDDINIVREWITNGAVD